MKTNLLFAALLSLITHKTAMGSEISKPMLWEITKNGQTSYLFGTIHTDVNLRDFPVALQDKLNEKPNFLSEMGGGEIGNDQGDNYLVTKHFSKDDQKKIEVDIKEKHKNFKGDITSLTTLQIATMLQMSPEEYQKLSNTPIDFELENLAQQKNKKIIALDNQDTSDKTMDELYKNSVSALSLHLKGKDELLKSLNSKNDDNSVSDKLLEKIISDYKKGELKCENMGADTGLILDKRNQEWVAKIESAHQAGGAFVAGGSAHFLCGKPTVLSGLKERGFTIRRVSGDELKSNSKLNSNKVAEASAETELISVN